MTNKYGFVVDTSEYSGNFERELTAYMTGVVGECEVGEKYVEEEFTEFFDELIEQVADDNGTYRPCKVYPNNKPSNHVNSSVIIYFYDKPSNKIIKILKERAEDFPLVTENKLNILGYRLVKFTTKVVEEEV